MSGECDDCGEHTLECRCRSNNQKYEEKFAIIGGDIHKLIRINKDENWGHVWRLHEKDDLYWVPVHDEKRDNLKGQWVWQEFHTKYCPKCQRPEYLYDLKKNSGRYS